MSLEIIFLIIFLPLAIIQLIVFFNSVKYAIRDDKERDRIKDIMNKFN